MDFLHQVGLLYEKLSLLNLWQDAALLSDQHHHQYEVVVENLLLKAMVVG